MLRATKWKLEKAKVKVVFRLQFHATNIPQSGWEKLFICFIPYESGKIIAKTSKANVRNGTCKWADPIYETTRLLADSRNKRYDDKFYKLIVGMGTSHASILGEATINLADYADASDPFVVALPLHGSEHGTILHVTVQLLTAKTGFREFEQQFDRGLQSSSSFNREVEPSIATSSSSELQTSDDHENKVNRRTEFISESKELFSIVEETDIHEEFSDSPLEYNGSCNVSESYNADKHDSSRIHDTPNLNGPAYIQSLPTEKADYAIDNKLAIAHEENQRLKGSLEMAESFIFNLKTELNTLHSHVNEMDMETQKIGNHLTDEISSGLKLEREIMMLKSECSKCKDEVQLLKETNSRSKIISDRRQLTWVNGLLLVEGRIRELQEKIRIGFRESNLSFFHSDLEMLLGIVQDLEKGTVQEAGFTRGFDYVEGKSLELLRELDESKAERGNLVKKMNEMERYYEALVQELEENQERILLEFQKLRYEHSNCVYTISTCKTETESIRQVMKNQILKFEKERLALVCVNEELEKRVMATESLVQELEENRERVLEEFQRLKSEHSTCADVISTCETEVELIQQKMKDQAVKFSKERHDLGCVNAELENRVMTVESRLQELEKNREKILGEFQSFKNKHSTCESTILTCKTENESIQRDMNDRILKFSKERDALSCVNKELEKKVSNSEALVQELKGNQDQILKEFENLKNEHSRCIGTISTCKSEMESLRCDLNDRILKFANEKHDLVCVNQELEKKVLATEALVQELEKNEERILGEFQSLKKEHLTCADTISTYKAEAESLRHDMNDQILKLSKERHVLTCVEELEKKVSELEENREQILEEFESLKNKHSACADTISTCKSETESIRDDMKDQILKFAKERHALTCVNEELEKKVSKLEENQEQILEEFESLKNEHSSCADTISTCKSETESIRDDMKDRILKFSKERHALAGVNEELKNKVSALEKDRKQTLEDYQNLKNDHSTCGDTISTCKTETESIRQDMKNQILKFTEEKLALDFVNKELEKRTATLESALENARLNYSVAVNHLQKNLDLLSSQVSSMFETNQNLIKGTYSESENRPNIIENSCEEELSGGVDLSDEQLYEICCVNLYLDVYSVTLEEKIFEVSVDANNMKQQMNEYAQKLQLLNEKKDPEERSESLRIAFMKEQCETTVQELKQQLFVSKRHGDDILIKLQDALDEIESRKKSEASYLKKIEELSSKVVGLEGELQSMQAELDCALLNLECCKEEKERIVAQIIELEGMKNDKSIFSMMSCSSSFQGLQRELMQLHKANEELEGMYPSFKNFTGDGNALERVLALEIELAGALMMKKKSSIQFQSSFLKQHSDEEAIFKSFRDINELIKDTLEIKSKYDNVETELKEMHERYSELSLQFAEVEGERQKLMMIVKNVRSPRNNLVRINRSSSETLVDNLL